MATFEYHGGPVLVVALGHEVDDGWTGEGPDALRHAAGFTETKAKPAKPAAPDPEPETPKEDV